MIDDFVNYQYKDIAIASNVKKLVTEDIGQTLTISGFKLGSSEKITV